MKLSSITNKFPDGQWFEYAGVLKVKLKYGQGLEHALSTSMAEFAVKAAQAIESGEDAALKDAEKSANAAALKIICTDYFIAFKAVEGEVEDDEGNPVVDNVANRMTLMNQVSDLYDFIDSRVSDYDYWK